MTISPAADRAAVPGSPKVKTVLTVLVMICTLMVVRRRRRDEVIAIAE